MTPVESDYMPAVRETWRKRCLHDRLKPGTKRRQMALECYGQGVLAVLASLGAMPQHRIGQIEWIFAVGRAESWLEIPEPAAVPAVEKAEA